MRQYKQKTSLSINPQRFRTLVHVAMIKKIIKRIALQNRIILSSSSLLTIENIRVVMVCESLYPSWKKKGV